MPLTGHFLRVLISKKGQSPLSPAGISQEISVRGFTLIFAKTPPLVSSSRGNLGTFYD
jgi:hypothetical protein